MSRSSISAPARRRCRARCCSTRRRRDARLARQRHVGDGDEPSRQGVHVDRREGRGRPARAARAFPPNYKVLFLQGGATAQNAAVPMNLLRGRRRRRLRQHRRSGRRSRSTKRSKYCRVNVAARARTRNFTYVPPQSAWKLSTGRGLRAHHARTRRSAASSIHWIPDTGDVPLVADMSSHILSRPIDVAKFGVIYAGAQKNIGPAGLTRRHRARRPARPRAAATRPSVFDYKRAGRQPIRCSTRRRRIAIYIAGLVFEWLQAQGGLAAIEQRNIAKAKLLYDASIAPASIATRCAKADRSRMNVPFILRDDALDDGVPRRRRRRAAWCSSRATARSAACAHRSTTRCRSPACVALTDCMREFERTHG